jgi:hypothetical protein
MQYMLIHFVDEDTELSPQAEADVERSLSAWLADVTSRGVGRHGSRLRPPSDATTIRSANGETLVADGPFAETKEQIAGYDLIECENLDEAIELASRHPTMRFGAIEIRPLLVS